MQTMKLGRYEIQSELGRGAMGRVVLAYDPQIDRKVAIKIIQSFSGLAGQDLQEARDRFLRSCRRSREAPPNIPPRTSSLVSPCEPDDPEVWPTLRSRCLQFTSAAGLLLLFLPAFCSFARSVRCSRSRSTALALLPPLAAPAPALEPARQLEFDEEDAC